MLTQFRIALHKQLLHEHHDFFLALQHPAIAGHMCIYLKSHTKTFGSLLNRALDFHCLSIRNRRGESMELTAYESKGLILLYIWRCHQSLSHSQSAYHLKFDLTDGFGNKKFLFNLWALDVLASIWGVTVALCTTALRR